MKNNWIGLTASALVLMATPGSLGGETPLASARPMSPTIEKRAALLATSARAALARGDAATAIRDAEAATLILPNDSANRALLGRSYLAAGRFISAETALGDALTLDPSQTRIAVTRALAQIALGQGKAALASLGTATGQAPEAEIGLALALLGHADEARQRLLIAARAPGADARTRQNLAFAFALEGRWNEAAVIAAQDVPADKIAERLRRWAMIAQLRDNPAMQVGALIGAVPVADNGQPLALALVTPPPAQEAAPQLAQAVAPYSPSSFIIPAAPAASEGRAAIIAEAAIKAPARIEAAVAPASVGPTVNSVAAPLLLSVAPPAIAPAPTPAPVVARPEAWAGPPVMREAPILRTPALLPSESKPAPAFLAAPRRIESKPGLLALSAGTGPIAPMVQARPIALKPLVLVSQLSPKPSRLGTEGKWVVQLGAYSSGHRTEIAWTRLSARAAFLNSYVPTGSGLRRGRATLFRLSVNGFATRGEATRLCVRIKTHGGACFVRAASGEQPMQWALRNRAGQPA